MVGGPVLSECWPSAGDAGPVLVMLAQPYSSIQCDLGSWSNSKHILNAPGLMLGQRRRRWSNIKPALIYRLVLLLWSLRYSHYVYYLIQIHKDISIMPGYEYLQNMNEILFIIIRKTCDKECNKLTLTRVISQSGGRSASRVVVTCKVTADWLITVCILSGLSGKSTL